MSRMPVFNSPFLLGFDHFERAVDRIAKMSAGKRLVVALAAIVAFLLAVLAARTASANGKPAPAASASAAVTASA